jgi:hypothetical protein
LHTREGAKRLAGQALARLRAAAHWISYLPFVAGRAVAVLQRDGLARLTVAEARAALAGLLAG